MVITAEVIGVLMNVIVTVTIALLIIGVFCLRALHLVSGAKKKKSCLLIPCFEQDSELEMTVKSAYWEEVIAGHSNAREIILLVSDDCPDVQKALALEEKYSIVHCVGAAQLERYLREKLT